jgi:hypothetical protein
VRWWSRGHRMQTVRRYRKVRRGLSREKVDYFQIRQAGLLPEPRSPRPGHAHPPSRRPRRPVRPAPQLHHHLKEIDAEHAAPFAEWHGTLPTAWDCKPSWKLWRPRLKPPLDTRRTARWTSSRKLPEILRLLRGSAGTVSLIALEKRVRPVAGNGSPIAWLRSAATIFFAGRK